MLDIEDMLIQEFPKVFGDDLGRLNSIYAKIDISDEVHPIFLKSRTVPYAMIDKVNEELNRLEKLSIIERVSSSRWATPIVSIQKSNGSIRICGDYKCTREIRLLSLT